MEPLLHCLAQMDAKAATNRAVKVSQTTLDAQVLARYGTLIEAEIKTLLIDDKWFASILGSVSSDVQRAIRQLAGRLQDIEERYGRPLSTLEGETRILSDKVEGHLQRMGFTQ